jgi:MoaA/NifB/PqqE/SkfB family radical SAM enzyme
VTQYYELDPSLNEFKTLSIQTTYKCQQTCANCYLGDMLNNDSIPNVDLVRFEEAIKALPKRTDIRFIGAEPTMNPNLVELIKITRRSGHRPSLLTNGLKLRREPYAQELKDAGLNLLGISMNGGLDNKVYMDFDNGRYAKSKMIALENIFKVKMLPHINVILDPSNVHVVGPLIDYIVEMALKHNIRFSPIKFPVMIRLKSVGKMGFYKDTHTFSIHELKKIVTDLHGDGIEFINTIDGHLEKRSLTYKFHTEAGVMLGKITDWTIDDEGIPDSGSTRRGILTDEYKVAPFFEYYDKAQKEL